MTDPRTGAGSVLSLDLLSKHVVESPRNLWSRLSSGTYSVLIACRDCIEVAHQREDGQKSCLQEAGDLMEEANRKGDQQHTYTCSYNHSHAHAYRHTYTHITSYNHTYTHI